jgi:ABC-type Fe3+/spermidine/putrescine transport system ATPase subunit
MAISHRNAVMNAGRIEQVGAPHLLYTKPRMRFVAGFVGRTNLLEARVEGSALLLGGLSLGAAAAAGSRLRFRGKSCLRCARKPLGCTRRNQRVTPMR